MCTSVSPLPPSYYKININHNCNSLALGDSIGCCYDTLSDQIYALAILSVIEMTLMEKCLRNNLTINYIQYTVCVHCYSEDVGAYR